ncbi:hypothetical protein KFK09_019339 [Dendrobium nobile]|uniref:Carbohydrate kinase PfkB domain-containing protein n=1 Tax=Dendrobium nobile TaxID=94219 RepID=A0A8T3APY0_DENNO|nr:hypothetical protein KFK09_019339 [Dendrobium nobile]
MASFALTNPLPLVRSYSSDRMVLAVCNTFQRSNVRLKNWCVLAISKKKAPQLDQQDSSFKESGDNVPKNTQQTRPSRKKVTEESPDRSSADMIDSFEEEKTQGEVSITASKKSTSRVLKKASSSLSPEEGNSERKVKKRKTRKKTVSSEDQGMRIELADAKEMMTSGGSVEDDKEEYKIRLKDYEEEDISFTYGWPPLVCCFGAAQHLFIPSGRLANRLIDHEIHESKKDMLWTPTKFMRAPGGSPSSVAIAHASIGGRVAFMGKLGDDEYGETILYHLNVNKVQTRAIIIDSSRATALSQMKISKRGGLKATVVKPCAEDSFLNSEINIDVLKEGKMFYFNSSSLLEESMRSTTMEAIRISKKYGGVIFFDLNLPLPLWKSSTETTILIQKAWNTADIIEVTKQELEFLSGIESSEKFDTKDNDKSKFTHHKHEMVKQLWHSNLKVLFVMNGTSKIHYYTLNDNGFVRGMEDAPITPYTCDMSVSGDALVAALMRMLTVQPHLITDKGYLEHMIKYAINCAVIDQWLLARIVGFPPKEGADPSSQTERRFLSISEKEYRTVEKAIS